MPTHCPTVTVGSDVGGDGGNGDWGAGDGEKRLYGDAPAPPPADPSYGGDGGVVPGGFTGGGGFIGGIRDGEYTGELFPNDGGGGGGGGDVCSGGGLGGGGDGGDGGGRGGNGGLGYPGTPGGGHTHTWT